MKSIAAFYCTFFCGRFVIRRWRAILEKQKSLGINQDFNIKRKRPQGMIWKWSEATYLRKKCGEDEWTRTTDPLHVKQIL